MRPIWAALTLTVLIAATAGCADPDTGPPSGTNGSPSPSAAASTALPLQFSRTGGLVGVDEQASISTDGTITDAAGRPRPLDEATFAQLKQLLADVPAAGPSPTPSSTSVCSDGYQYRLRTPSWSAATDDCSLPSQPALAPLVRLLTPLLRDPATPPSGTASPR